MSNVSLSALHNDSKQQMILEVTAEGVEPVTQILIPDGAMAIGVRNSEAIKGHLNQIDFQEFLKRAIQKIRDANVLSVTYATDFPNGAIIHGPLNSQGETTIVNLTGTRAWFPFVQDGEGYVILPIEGTTENNWVENGFTLEMTTLGTRMIEKMREEFLIFT